MKHKLFRGFSFDAFASRVSSDDVGRVFNELYQIRWKLATDDDVKFFLENINYSLVVRKNFLLIYLGRIMPPVSDNTLVCLFYLLEDQLFPRLGYFINVLKVFYAEEQNIMLVEVNSRFDLGDENLMVYRASLHFLYKKKIEYIFRKNDSLVGGFRLRWYNGELDLSVRRQIDQVKQTILQGR